MKASEWFSNGVAADVGFDIVELTSFNVDIDLVATYGACARKIVVVTAGGGTLNLTAVGVAGTPVNRSLTVWDRWEQPVGVTKIQTGTTATKIQVIF